jgi:hypothetical protein
MILAYCDTEAGNKAEPEIQAATNSLGGLRGLATRPCELRFCEGLYTSPIKYLCHVRLKHPRASGRKLVRGNLLSSAQFEDVHET